MGLVSKRGEDDDEDRGDISIAGMDDLDGAEEDTVYELDEWGERGLGMLRERLDTLGVPHRWEEGSTLVIAATDEAWVERIMDQVEDDLSLALDPDVPQIAYDLTEWDADNRERLFVMLEEEAVPYGVDGEELFVHEIDEQRADDVIDAILRPSSHVDGAGDGGPEVMGELFVAADLLVHDPNGAEGTLALVEAIRQAGASGVPYGMDKVWWDAVVDRAGALAGLLDVPEIDESMVIESATELRDGLRPYV